VKCGFDSRLGKVESDWKREGDEVAFEVTVPVEATVELPNGRRETVGAGMHRFVVKDDPIIRHTDGEGRDGVAHAP